MSFSVSRRTRDIGIRAALGAQPRRILAAIFSRSMGQIGLGVVVGASLAFITRNQTGMDDYGALAAVAAIMMAIGLLACVAPAWRALRIQPSEAFRLDG